MKVKLRVGNRTVLLAPEQFEELTALLDGVEHLEEEHVGERNGYTGYRDSYVYNFAKFNPERDIEPVAIADSTLDKYRTIYELRQQPKENES